MVYHVYHRYLVSIFNQDTKVIMMNEQLLKVSASQREFSFQNSRKSQRWGGIILHLVRQQMDNWAYRLAWKFCGSFILRIGDFLWFAGTNFCGTRWLKFLLGTNFCESLFKQQRSSTFYFQLLFYGMLSHSSLFLHTVSLSTLPWERAWTTM